MKIGLLNTILIKNRGKMTEEDFFEQGYYITKAPNDIQSMLWQIIHTTNWVKTPHKTFLQYETDYLKIPSWHPEITTNSNKPYLGNHYWGSKDPDKHPRELVKVGEITMNNPCFSILNEHREMKLKYMTMWNGAGELPWHSDVNDSTDIIVLYYMTDQDYWDDSWGGILEVRKNFSDKDLYYNKVQPLSSTMVVLNNMNPMLQHKITAMLNPEINRYTFNFCYSWT